MDAGVFFQDSNYPDDLPYELATKDDVAAAKLECEDEASASQKKNEDRFVRPSITHCIRVRYVVVQMECSDHDDASNQFTNE